ncbi:hypothetical protein HMPREF1020_03214 [Clostridium sp. 7_3_54FAA]|nr:hypothetical protein HMPREF1020_03214 [Clostridium sp. 7_3_54FAA]
MIMNLLTIEHLTKSYTERLLFDDTSFSINEGDKIGLIGINGTGKSTLLKIAAGLEEPDLGTVVRGRNLYIRYLPQNPGFEPQLTVLECVIKENEGHEHVWDLEGQAKNMLTRLGVSEYDAVISTLSGGQKKRVALASVLLSAADLLVLDEPTNHLDSSMADWLEDYLKKFRGALLMITHDRYFLDSVSNRIVELDKGKLYSYQAGYGGYLELKEERMAMEQASERKRRSILRTELEWIRRGARARSTKQKGRIQRFEELSARKGPEEDGDVEMNSLTSRLGRTTVEVSHLNKSYGDKVLLRDFTYIFLKNDRIGIIGPNGSGKSTLMKMIAGLVQPDSGETVIGQTVRMGYFSQDNEEMDDSLKVIDYIKNVAEYVKTPDGMVSASQMLEQFLFPSSMQYTLIGKLSGGEKRRLCLLHILMGAPNVLLLDEPTNDLDIRTLTILEDYLDHFQGIVIAVSHDRYFLDRVVRRIFAFEGDGAVKQYEGGYTDYQAALEERGQGQEESTAAKAGAEDQSQPNRKNWKEGQPRETKLKFTYKEQREWETIEETIAALEEEVAELEGGILQAASDYSRLNRLMQEKEEKEAQLEEKMERWMYLNELAEQIGAQ